MIIESEEIVKSPLVSVVIATYNQNKYIEDTIKSALSQNCNFLFEVVVGDDGSNDGERDTLIELQKQYPTKLRLIFNEKNMRVTKNYVNIIKNSRGKYIAPLDGDDLWNQAYKLQKQVDILEKDYEVACVHCGYIKLYDDTGAKIKTTSWNSPLVFDMGKQAMDDVIKERFSHFPVFSNMLFRKDIIVKYNNFINKQINNPYTRGEGMIFFTILSNEGRWAFINEPMSIYRILGESTSHFKDNNAKAKFELFYLFQKLSVAKDLKLSCKTIIYLNLKIVKFFFSYTKNCDRNIIRSYYNDYKASQYCELSIFIKFLLNFY